MEGKDRTICTGKKMIVSNHKGLHLFSIALSVKCLCIIILSGMSTRDRKITGNLSKN